MKYSILLDIEVEENNREGGCNYGIEYPDEIPTPFIAFVLEMVAQNFLDEIPDEEFDKVAADLIKDKGMLN